MKRSMPATLGDKYRIVELLGKGGFAAVYRAVDTTLDREVAIKVLDPLLLGDPTFVNRFQREAKAVARLKHPNIVGVLEIGEYQGQHFIAMPCLPGPDVGRLIARQGALDPAQALRIAGQVGAALDYAHQQGLIHRDVKPSNVLLDERGDAILTDFGIAKVVNESTVLTRTGASVGTPHYMAPEQWTTGRVDARSDLYALGVMLYQMLTGQVPFDGETPRIMYAHVHEAPPAPQALNPALPSGVGTVLLKALAKNPEQRYQTAGHLVADLQAALSGRLSGTLLTGTSITVASAPPPATQPQPRGLAWPLSLPVTVGAAIAVIVLVLLALVVFRGGRPAAPTSPATAAVAGLATATRTPTPAPTSTMAPSATPTQPAPTQTPLILVVTATSPPAPPDTPTPPGPTATPVILVVTATPTQAPRATRVPEPAALLPAPTLLEPEEGTAFEDVNAQVLLEWSPVKPSLAPDEYYFITIPYRHQGQLWTDFAWTQQTSWPLREHEYLLDMSDDGTFRWSVVLMRQTGTGDNGVPQGIPLSQSSQERSLVWRRPSPGGDGGGGGGYGGY
jgi:serine/threonine-protein kinase